MYTHCLHSTSQTHDRRSSCIVIKNAIGGGGVDLCDAAQNPADAELHFKQKKHRNAYPDAQSGDVAASNFGVSRPFADISLFFFVFLFFSIYTE